MATAKKKSEASTELQILEIKMGVLDMNIVGTSPLICNRMSQNTKQELLMPKGKKNAAEKAGSLKHDPIAEFNTSPYLSRSDSDPTLLLGLGSWFKGAIRGAALDMPGAAKTQVGRLTSVPDFYISLYGIPQIFMAVTRSKDINRTPDVRTRAIIPKWAARVRVRFIQPILNFQAVANLAAAGGQIQGVGDWRQEKGSGSFGSYRLAAADDAEFLEIVRSAGRAAQLDAMANPVSFDAETDELLSWYHVELKRRGGRPELRAVS